MAPLDEYPFSVVFSPIRLNCDLWSLSRVRKSWHIVFGLQRERAKRLFRKILIEHTWCRFALENGEDTVALSVRFSLPDDYCDSPDDIHCAALREPAHWQQFAASVKNLVRLELSNILCYHVPVVLEATARECPLIQVLGIDRMYMREDESLMPWFDRFMDELRRGLERWHLTTGGLRMLCMGELLVYRLDVADRILEMVASYCPRIERLEATTYDGCAVQASIWQQFWNTCTEVCEFEWKDLRWDAALCRAFATTQRPKFRTLCVDDADWAWVREDATLLTSLARAVTNLRRLRLEGEPADVTRDTPLDELAQLLAVHCPCLVSASVDSKHSLMGCVGVSALASAPSVTSVAFWRARCERGMLVDVFERLCQRDSRTLEISFLQSWVDDSEMFPTFLAYLKQVPPDRFANLRLSLRVAINGYAKQPGWSYEHLHNLVHDIRQRHAATVRRLDMNLIGSSDEVVSLASIGGLLLLIN